MNLPLSSSYPFHRRSSSTCCAERSPSSWRFSSGWLRTWCRTCRWSQPSLYAWPSSSLNFFLKVITVKFFPFKMRKTETTEFWRQRRLHVAGWSAAAAWEGNRFSVRSAAATQLSHSGSSYSLPLQPGSTQLTLTLSHSHYNPVRTCIFEVWCKQREQFNYTDWSI